MSSGYPRQAKDVFWHGAITSPYYDEIIVGQFGVQVISEDLAANTIKVQVRRPAYRASVELVERQGRAHNGSQIIDRGIVYLNRENDPGLCKKEAVGYHCTVTRYGEEVVLDTVAQRMGTPTITAATLGGHAVPAGTSTINMLVRARTHAIVAGGTTPGNIAAMTSLQATERSTAVSVTVIRDPMGITIRTPSGAGSYDLDLDIVVADTSAMPSPTRTRNAHATINIVGERIEYDEQYREDSERCWLTRLDVPQRRRFSFEDLIPSHLDPNDSRVVERLRVKFLPRSVDTGEHR